MCRWPKNTAPEYVAPDSTNTYYNLAVPAMGWINCGHFYGSDPDLLTTVSYESDDDDLTNVMIFLYFDEIGSVMRAYDSESGQVPIGASVKSLCFAMNSSGAMFYHYETFNITSGHTVQVTMEEISESDLLALMAGL